jgi:hypothetical protein
MAVGSSFLVAGSANATVKTIKPTITVCKSIAGSFHFSINGKSFSLSSQCAAVTAKAGVNEVVETWAPASYRSLAAISVSPNTARVSASLKTATAFVKLAAHGAATVRFTNAKVVTQVVTKTGSLQTATGYIEVCKYASDGWVEGTFPFTVTQSGAPVGPGTTGPGGAAAVAGTYYVATGQCTSAITVTAGTNVVVTEGSEAPYYVSSVTASPSLSLASSTLGSNSGAAGTGVGSGTFTIAADEITLANFYNSTAVGWIKVCKILADDQGSLAGSTFKFNISWTLTPPTSSTAITGTGSVSVIAVDAANTGGACAVPLNNAGWINGIPVGATVTVTEAPFADVAVSNVAITPPSAAVTSPAPAAGTAVLTVQSGGYVADASFTNDPLGVVEVCKNFWPSGYDANDSATFTVNGGAPITVNGGECSAPIWVPAGTATVAETLGANFFLYKVSTQSATDPFGTRLLTADTVNPASVTVPYGGVGDETVVTFTNTVDPTQFKICKQESSPDANLSGQTFTFDWSYSDSNYEEISGSGTVSLTIEETDSNPTGLVCSGLIWGPPSIDPSGDSVNINITEESTPIADVAASSITYQGNGSLIYDSTDGGSDPQVVSGDGSAASCIDPGAGISVVTFTNSRTVGYVAPPA